MQSSSKAPGCIFVGGLLIWTFVCVLQPKIPEGGKGAWMLATDVAWALTDPPSLTQTQTAAIDHALLAVLGEDVGSSFAASLVGFAG